VRRAEALPDTGALLGDEHPAGVPDGRRGAYGIRIAGVTASESMLVEAEPEWPQLSLCSELGNPVVDREDVGTDHAVVRLKTGGRLTLERGRGTACYSVPRPLSDEELVHPFLAPAAAVVSHWAGRVSLHAGGFVADGGVWAVVGHREAGKSSTLAWLARSGHAVVADDVLVLDGRWAFAGPRAIDLREETAERFGIGAALGVVGTRPRWRVPLPQVPARLPFRGWVFLAWGDRIGARRVGAGECLSNLMASLTLRVDASNPQALLELATLPAWEVRRPRDWDRLEEGIGCLLELTR
jgi:hypothetical protein